MRRPNVNLYIRLTVLLALCVFVSSCKKSPQDASKEQSEQSTVEQSVAETKKDTPKPDMIPLKIKLPRPMFVGTPSNIRGVTNLEEPRRRGTSRPTFYVPEGTTNIALGKSVTATDEQPIIGTLELITDGDKEAMDGSYVEMAPFKQYITIDLGVESEIYAIVLWHYHKQVRVYFDVIVQVADDPDFLTNVRTLFNNDADNSSALGVGEDKSYVETSEGRLIDAKGQHARYVRLYSNGNSTNELNHYIEVEVFGRQVSPK